MAANGLIPTHKAQSVRSIGDDSDWAVQSSTSASFAWCCFLQRQCGPSWIPGIPLVGANWDLRAHLFPDWSCERLQVIMGGCTYTTIQRVWGDMDVHVQCVWGEIYGCTHTCYIVLFRLYLGMRLMCGWHQTTVSQFYIPSLMPQLFNVHVAGLHIYVREKGEY